jgi:hypothetical protein
VNLEEWNVVPANPTAIHISSQSALQGIRSGQTLAVAAGGKLGDNFNAGWGSIVAITGGQVGRNFEALGAHVTITGGSVGDQFGAFYGTVVNISGGSVGNQFEAHNGSIVNIAGGHFSSNLYANSGSVINVSGGSIGAIQTLAGSTLNLFGYGFLMNGAAIGPLIPGQPRTIDDRNVTLSGYLANGSPFAFELRSMYTDSYSDYFDPSALLTISSVLSGDYNGDGVVDAADYMVWRNTLGQVGSELAADGNGNGRVDAGDFDVWKANFGNDGNRGAIANAVVPEPATIALMTLATACCFLMQCRSQRRLWHLIYA